MGGRGEEGGKLISASCSLNQSLLLRTATATVVLLLPFSALPILCCSRRRDDSVSVESVWRVADDLRGRRGEGGGGRGGSSGGGGGGRRGEHRGGVDEG